MARYSLGKSQRSHWFFLGRNFAKRNVSMETVISRVYPINYRCGKYNIENFFHFSVCKYTRCSDTARELPKIMHLIPACIYLAAAD